jgi:MGT family glycosyltransferase
MAKFLFTVWPFAGHVHPNLAIAHELSLRNHIVAFYSGNQMRELIEREGFKCFPFDRVDGEHVERLVRSLDNISLQKSSPRKGKAILNEWLLGTIPEQLEDLEAIVDEWKPDVIVCDLAMWGPILILHETKKIPVAIFSYVAASILPGPEGPVLGVPLARPKNWYSRTGIRVLRTLIGLLTRDARVSANRLRQEYGLDPISGTVTEHAGQLPLYLIPSAPEFDRERSDLPPSVRYVGPCQWNGTSTEPTPDWIAELGQDRPVVYVTEGTMHEKGPLLLNAALDGLANNAIQVVMTTGRHREFGRSTNGTVPENIRIERWVDHNQLFPRVDVVVTTGGSGTVLAALTHGIPLVVVPTAWDQPENAWRVAEAGAGVRLPPGSCTPDALAAAVDRVLSEPLFRQNAERLSTVFSRYGGAAQAAWHLEELVESAGKTRVLSGT